jgi:hypothetical protein
LLNYSEDVLALLCHEDTSGTDYLFALNVSTREVVMPLKAIDNSNRIFVRHTKEVLIFGRHTAHGSRGHREWLIQAVSLTDRHFQRYCRKARCNIYSMESDVIQLHDFPGSDVGSTVAFKIHDGYFYALSNCSAFDVVEVDWTSFYHCIKFPIDNPGSETCQINPRIYRRQHHEGPINDSWTELSLQVDEYTNQLLIVEARTEWTSGGTSQTRTFYAQEIPAMISVVNLSDHTQDHIGPADDLFSTIPDDDSKYSPWQEREPWQFHPERAHATVESSENSSCGSSFILARTKFRSYNFSTGTFIDIVEAPCGCRGPRSLCLRLRTGSRQAEPFLPCSWTPSLRGVRRREKSQIPSVRSSCPSPIRSELLESIPAAYRYKPINMWPPHFKESQRAAYAHDVMNLDPRSSAATTIDFKAASDERSLVYLILPSGGGSTSKQRIMGKLVCLCFDGDAAVAKHKSFLNHMDIQHPADKPRQITEDDLMTDVCSPPPSPFDVPDFEPSEAAWSAYETVWDEYPDAEELDLDQVWAECASGGIGVC